MKLFLITQNLNYLYGKYVTRAVVAAPDARKAKSLLVHGYCKGLVVQLSRLSATHIGETKRKAAGVYAIETGVDHDGLPSPSDSDDDDDDFDD